MEHSAEGVRELAVGHRLGGRHVHRAGGGRCVEAEEDRADHVVEMHPGHVLPPAGHRTAHAQLEGRKHLLERTARLGQHHAGPGGDHAHAQLLGARASVSHPRVTWARKSSAAGADSSSRSSPRAPYQPAGGLRDERGRPLGLRERRQPGHEVARAEHTRVADLAPGVIGPALGDRRAREVHHRVAAAERLGRGRLRERVLPAHGLHAELAARRRRASATARSPRRRGPRAPAPGRAPIIPVAPVTTTFTTRPPRRG